MKIVWTQPAHQDLRDIFTCILPYRVKDQQIQILAVLHGAKQWPESFTAIPESH